MSRIAVHQAGSPAGRSNSLPPLILVLVALSGCQSVPPAQEIPAASEPGVSAAPISLTAPRFSVDAKASEVRLLVYRAGPLARFGHNHVIVGRVRGEIRAGDTAAQSGFRLEIPVDSFEVDPATARAEEGGEFSVKVSAEARQGTRKNMLGAALLDAAKYPLIRIESAALTGPRWNPAATARVTLHGKTHDVRFPAAVFQHGYTLVVIATFTIRQTEFGIEPFAVLGGGLKVRDAVDVRIHLVAHLT